MLSETLSTFIVLIEFIFHLKLMIRLIYAFSKHSRQMKAISTKEKVRATAVSDDKSGKIAKAEQEAE